MSKRIVLSLLLVSFFVVDTNAQNRVHRRRGAILGGIAGAAVGVAIGDKGNNETAGALIGGAVGAIAGGSIGDQKDRRIEQQQHHSYQAQQYRSQLEQQQALAHWQAQQRAQQQAARALTNDDVVTMVRRGLGEPTIVQYIRVNGIRNRLTISDIISLHEQGVSEPIINAMQSATVVYDESMPSVDQRNVYPMERPAYGVPSRGVINHGMSVEQRSYGPSIIVPLEPSQAVPPAGPPQPWNLAPAR